MEVEIQDGSRNPGKSGGILCEGVTAKYAWIDGVCDTYPLAVLCRMLSVSTSGFADWKSCDGPMHWLSGGRRQYHMVLSVSVH
jgi:hypothetical protein